MAAHFSTGSSAQVPKRMSSSAPAPVLQRCTSRAPATPAEAPPRPALTRREVAPGAGVAADGLFEGARCQEGGALAFEPQDDGPHHLIVERPIPAIRLRVVREIRLETLHQRSVPVQSV